LAEKAELLALSGERGEAIVLSDSLIARVADKSDQKELTELARGLGTNGMALAGEGRYQEAIEVFDTLVARFEDAPEFELRAQVALALTNKSMALHALGHEEESLSVREDMVSRFGEVALVAFDNSIKQFAQATEPKLREQLASVLYNKARVLNDLGRPNEALPVLTELITRFDSDENPTIQVTVSSAREARDEMIDDQSD
jgi:tetratricopeptide (TPR) repeat protein